MILTRAEGRDFSKEPKPDLNYVEDGIYPASFVKCTEEQGQYGPQIKWLFTLDEVNNVKIFVSMFTSSAWAPGHKLDSLLVVLGIDTTNNFDLSTFDTNMIQQGTKALLMVSKKMSQKGNVYLKVDKCLPYSPNARGAEPLMFPQEHMIMPEINQQQAPVAPQVTVQYQPINNQPAGMSQQFQQQQYAKKPQSYPATGINRITTPAAPNSSATPTTPNYVGQPPVKKVDFGSQF